jgi:hypothetical protein
VSNFSEHTNANYFFHTGTGQQGRPSAGAWATYGLGSQCQELPGFIVLGNGMIPPGGIDCFSNGFLPASYQGSIFKHGAAPVADLQASASQKSKLDLIRKLDRGQQARLRADGTPTDPLDAAIANSELAARMQTAVPNLYDISKENRETLTQYGIDDPKTQIYGTQCLIARRLMERGVRFVEGRPRGQRPGRGQAHRRTVKRSQSSGLAGAHVGSVRR